MNTRRLLTLFTLFAFFLAKPDLQAAENVDHATVLKPFLNDDTTIVAYLNVAAQPSPGNAAELMQLLPRVPQETQSKLLGLMMTSSLISKFQAAGGQGVYAVFGLLDIYDEGGPLVIATTAPGKHPEEVERFFRDVIHELRDSTEWTNRPLADILDTRRQGNLVLFGTTHTLDRYTSLAPGERTDILEPLERLSTEGAVVAVVDAPGPDCRRIFRELWPTFPPPLTALRGELVDHLKHIEFSASAPPNVNPQIVIQTTDAATAQTFVDLYRAIPAAIDTFIRPGKERDDVKHLTETITDMFTPQLERDRVTFDVTTPQPRLADLQSMLFDLTDKALESRRRNERFNEFKQLLIAMLSYTDANKHLPPAAICDKDGRPLLSWRVAILPYLEQKELYDQFHLDEPWDSPHNRTLISRMPAYYADPDPKIRQAAGDGKTTFQVPVGPDTVFSNNEGTTYKEITDGTSHTLILIEVDPIHATIWTRPEDWQVDMEHPLHGIERTDRKYIMAGFADAHVAAMPTDEDSNTVRAVLTRAGGETVAQPPY